MGVLDKDSNGHLSETEFQKLLRNKELSQEICSASLLKAKDLRDLFFFLNYQDTDGELKVDLKDFIEKLELESNDVSERSVFRMEKQLKLLEKHMDQKLDTVAEDLSKSVACILKGQNSRADHQPDLDEQSNVSVAERSRSSSI